MKKFWQIIYNIVAYPILQLFFLMAPLMSAKIRTSVKDRRKLFENLIIDLAGINRSKKMIWFHSASMGEFEQAKPIIEKLRSEKDVNIIITFFSPSGYRNSLKYPYADIISYLPFDTPAATSRFLNLVRPHLAIFMRYDIWPNMIWQIDKKKIPYMIVDATMRSNNKRKYPIVKSFHKALYSGVEKILAVSQNDADNFKVFDIAEEKIKVVGDTRFDRVYQKSLSAKEKKLFKDNFFGDKKVFVLGSSWESDEDVLLPAILKLIKYDKDIVVVIVPHEPTLIHIERLENILHGKYDSLRFSFLNNYKNERVIIVDSIGILLTLYYYSNAAYVGGSFFKIHNVLEPAVYGIPVLYGPKYGNSQEAVELVKRGGGIVVRNKQEAYRNLRKIFSNESFRNKIGSINGNYVKENIGATQKMLEEIYTLT
jgi:3-deoxy-D-manno-octulosonic-acid transferase